MLVHYPAALTAVHLPVALTAVHYPAALIPLSALHTPLPPLSTIQGLLQAAFWGGTEVVCEH